MATKDNVDSGVPVNGVDRALSMNLVERLHVQKALQLYSKSVERSRANEVPGSDVYRFRTIDLDVIRGLLNRVA